MHLIINQSSVSCANAHAEQGFFRHPLGGAGPIGASDDLVRLLFVVLGVRFPNRGADGLYHAAK